MQSREAKQMDKNIEKQYSKALEQMNKRYTVFICKI